MMNGSAVLGWKKRGLSSVLGACLLSLALSAAAVDGDDDENARDPYKGFNKAMFAVNEAIDGVVTKPLAQAYDAAVPLPAKVGTGNFFGTIGDAWIGINNVMQGKFADAAVDAGRLAVNLTLGIFGLFDVASELGLEKHDEDFGQTLAVWGVGDGPYLYWPIIGPRNLRDTAGWAADIYVDPVGDVSSVPLRNTLMTLRLVDIRSSLLPTDKVVDEAALDKYSYVRDAYIQRRRNQVYDGRPPRLDDY